MPEYTDKSCPIDAFIPFSERANNNTGYIDNCGVYSNNTSNKVLKINIDKCSVVTIATKTIYKHIA